VTGADGTRIFYHGASPKIPPGVVLVIGANVVFGTGLFFHAFLYNFYLEALGHAETVMGNAAGALTLGGLIALLPAGRVTDRLSPKASLLLASLVVSAGLALGAFVETPGAIYAAAALAGMGGGAWRVAAPPALMRLAAPALRPRAFAWNVGLLIASGGLGMAVAGSVPGWLETHLGLALLPAIRLALLVGAAGGAFSLPLFALLPSFAEPPAPVIVPAHAAAGGDAAGGRVGRAILPLVGFVGLWMLGPALAAPFLNIFFTRQFAVSVATVGVIFAAAHLLWGTAVFFSGGLAGRVGLLRFLTFTLVLFPAAMVGLSLTTGLAVAIALFILQGLIAPLTNPLIDQLLLARAPVRRHGAVSSWRNAAADLSGLAGASLGGALLARGSFALLLGSAAALGALGATGLLVALGRIEPASEPASGDALPATDAGVSP